MDFAYIGTSLLLVLGFGFVIFWHELGHFLAAKWVGVKVEQFAVGFGQATARRRKGMGCASGPAARSIKSARVRSFRRRAAEAQFAKMRPSPPHSMSTPG